VAHRADGTAIVVIERFLPVAGSQHAAALDRVLLDVHYHMALQAIGWGLFFVYVLIRFRSGAQPVPRAGNLRPLIPILAIAVVVVGDAVLLATAALPAWLARSTVPESLSPPLEIRVTGEQFAWNIHYAGRDGRFGRTGQELIGPANPIGIDRSDPAARDDIGILNTLTLPLGRTVIVYLSSRDVIHSFTLNEMRVRQDAVPGIPSRTWFTPIVAGKWDIACSQLCGLGHYRMRGEYTVLPPAEWDEWLKSEEALLANAR
jgi:cytochrome c oxidase subunit 2